MLLVTMVTIQMAVPNKQTNFSADFVLVSVLCCTEFDIEKLRKQLPH